MTLLSMNNKFPVYLAKIEFLSDGARKFVKADNIFKETIWGTAYNRFFFKLRRVYFNKPNCNLSCPPEKEFFCCRSFGCNKNCGFFEWEEISFFSEEEQNIILSLWDARVGFLAENGCALPRELRSFICLIFQCNHSKTKK